MRRRVFARNVERVPRHAYALFAGQHRRAAFPEWFSFAPGVGADRKVTRRSRRYENFSRRHAGTERARDAREGSTTGCRTEKAGSDYCRLLAVDDGLVKAC